MIRNSSPKKSTFKARERRLSPHRNILPAQHHARNNPRSAVDVTVPLPRCLKATTIGLFRPVESISNCLFPFTRGCNDAFTPVCGAADRVHGSGRRTYILLGMGFRGICKCSV